MKITVTEAGRSRTWKLIRSGMPALSCAGFPGVYNHNTYAGCYSSNLSYGLELVL